MIGDKLDKIDNLLNDNNELLKYIENIEKEDIKIQDNFEQDLFENISIVQNIMKKQDNEKEQKNIHYTFIDIMKVACFTALTLVIWQVGIVKFNNLEFKEKTSIEKNREFTNHRFDNFLMGEIIKGGEK